MDSQNDRPASKQSPLTLSGSIIIAGALVAMAIIWVKQPSTLSSSQAASAANGASNAPTTTDLPQINMRPVTAADHIYGNPNAQIKIVEYSDPSCPFCKMFNPTMEEVMTAYGPSGKVAWIYRSFPLDKPDQGGHILHPNAGHESQALECAASLGGNDKFWAFEKHLYETTPSVTPDSPNGLDQKLLPSLAKDIGLDPVAFNECLSSNQFKDKVEKDYLDGLNAGVAGTPHSVIITPSGSKIPLIGAQAYATVKAAIDALLPANQ